MVNNKAQVTIFIILGIITLSIVGLSLYLTYGNFSKSKTTEAEKTISIPPELASAKDYIGNCFEETAEEGIYTLGRQGGYYNIPDSISTPVITESLAYYYLNKSILTPSTQTIEKELEKYVSNNIDGCLSYLTEKGFTIQKGNKSVTAKILNKEVNVEVTYPLRLEKHGTSGDLKNFPATIKSNIKKLQETSSQIVETYSQKAGFTCLTCIDKLANENNVHIQIAYPALLSGKNITEFLLTDKEYEEANHNMTLRFVVES